ncbi:hypothetical protein N7478_012332 [Penicillium angulare]|uniref:uncharacterized protein n=1 Tax=Penicillium angulare TaxID=116970 RepID=UPI00253FCCE8|nr:uncharacterized protein N7478_012332 [Penicillium angulare]KAJ5259351.1 hypothetical protein N7478_012332 [Penicillium angulare]
MLSLRNLSSPGGIDDILYEPLNGLFDQPIDNTLAHGGIFLPALDYTPLASQALISPRAEDSLSEYLMDPAILEECCLPAVEKNTTGAASACVTFRA